MTTIDPDRTRRVIYLRQRVVCLLAAGSVGVAAAANGDKPLLAGPFAVASLALGALAVPRWRGRAPVSWIGTAVRFLSRKRRVVARNDRLPFCANIGTVELQGTSVGAIADGYGVAAIIEISDPAALLVTGGITVPMPAELAGSPSFDEPAATVQMLVIRRGHFQRSLVAVRVGADGLAWTDAELRHTLSGAVRGVLRRLARAGAPARALTAADASNALEWSVAGGTDPTIATVDETWSHLQIGNARHVTVRVGLEPRAVSPDTLDGLLGVNASVVALSVAEDHLLLRLTATTPSKLSSTVAAAVAACPGIVSRLDGEQLAGFTATLPLGHADLPSDRVGVGAAARPAMPVSRTVDRVDGKRKGSHRVVVNRRGGRPSFSSVGTLTLPDTGLLLGHDRRGAPVQLQLDPSRTTPVRLAVVGCRTASRVLSDRLRALAAEADGSTAVPVAMAVLERPTAADSATLATADVIVCQPVSQPEAALVASALGLTRAGEWLSRIEGDMIAIISDGAVRWARLSAHAGNRPRNTA